jgi:hypothetical protein
MSVHICQDQRKECGSQALQRCAKNLEFSEKVCACKHELLGTGAIFLRSYGYLFCNECHGLQKITGEIK